MSSFSDAADKDKSGWLWVLLLFLVALGLRSWGINQGFWYDEIFSLQNFFRAEWTEIFTSMPDPNHHPLYTIIAKLCIGALGESEWSARLPALVAGAATVPSLFRMGERFLGRVPGLVGSGFLCVHMWHVYFSQDARGYSLMILLSLFSWWLFLLLLEEISYARAAGYVLVTVLSLYTHLYSIALPLGHLLAALCLVAFGGTPRREGARLAMILAAPVLISALFYLPMLGDMVHYVRTEGQILGSRRFTPGFIWGLLLSWSSGSGRVLLSIPCLGLAFMGIVFSVRDKPIVALTWAAPLLFGFLVPLVSGTFVYHRFYSFALPGFLLFAGYGFYCVFQRASLREWMLVVVFFAAVSVLFPGLFEYYRVGKQGFKDAAEWIEDEAPYARVYSLGLAGDEFQYYCPEAVVLSDESPLESSLLKDSVVVFSYPWSLNLARRQRLSRLCGEPVVFESAGYAENRVYLYRCR